MQNQSITTLKSFAFLLLGVFLFSLPPAIRAANVTMTANDSGTTTTSINGAGKWDNSAAPSLANDYYSTNFIILAPTASATFLGNSLTINTNASGTSGQLQGQGSSSTTLYVTNLILAGGIVRGTKTAAVNFSLGFNGSAPGVAGSTFVNVNSASSLGATSSGVLVINSLITNSGALQIPDVSTDTGVVRLGAPNTYSGTITVSNNTYSSGVNHLLLLFNADAVSNATVNLTAPANNPVAFGNSLVTFNVGALTGSSTQALTNTSGAAVTLSVGGNNSSGVFSGALTGSGAVTKVGTGTLTLSGTNTYTGATTVSAGTLVIDGAGQLGGGSYAGNITNNSVLVNNSSAAQIWSGVISGTGSLTNSGGGTLILSGPNTYSGATTISNGSLFVSSAKSGTGNILLADGATLGVTVSGTSQLPPANLALGTSAGATLIFSNVTSTSIAPINTTNVSFAGTLTLNINSGSFTAGNNYPLVKWTGSGLSSTNGITLNLPLGVSGNLAIVGSTLYLQTLGSVSSVQPLSWTGGDGTWDVNNSFNNTVWKDAANATTYYKESPSADQVVFDTTVGTGGTVTLSTTVSPANVTVSNGVAAYTITGSGAIAGSTGLTKSGTNILTLATLNTYTGGTTVNAGTLQLGDGSSVPGTVVGNLTNNAALVFASPSAQTFAGTISGSGSVTVSGPGTQIFAGANTYTANTVVNAGTLQLGDGTANNGTVAGNITNNTTLVFANPNAQTYGGVISGPGTVTESGPGVLTLTGNNTYLGGTILSAGTLNITNDAALGTTNGGITFSGSSTLQVGASLSLNTNRAITINSGLTATFDPLANQFTVSNNITGAGTLKKPAGAGTLILAGDNSGWTGGVAMANSTSAQGWLQLASSTALGPTGTAKTIALNNSTGGATGGIQLINNVTIDASKTLTIGGRSSGLYVLQNVSGNNAWAGTVQIAGTGGSYYLNSAAGQLELSGRLYNNIASSSRNFNLLGAGDYLIDGTVNDGGSGKSTGLIFNGMGTATLTNNNLTYTAGTTISSGTVVNNGTVATSTVTVTGGFLRGIGVFGGAVTVTNNGNLAPGTVAALGTLTISNTLTLTATSTNIFRLDAGAITNDLVAGLTNVIYGGNLVVTNVNGTPVLGQVYQLYSSAAYSGTFSNLNLPALPPTLAWSNNLVVDGTIQVVTNTFVASTNALLTSLVINPAGNLSPSFASGVIAYTTTNSYGSTPTVTVTNADLTATNVLIYNGTTNLLTSGVASGALTLNTNPGVTNVIKVQVTAQDGVTVNTYTVNVQQLPSVSSRPVLTNSIGVNNLTLNWPLANLGYRLQIQTNSLSTGLSGNWVDWPNSTQTNNAVIPVIPGNPSVFLRLVYP